MNWLRKLTLGQVIQGYFISIFTAATIAEAVSSDEGRKLGKQVASNMSTDQKATVIKVANKIDNVVSSIPNPVSIAQDIEYNAFVSKLNSAARKVNQKYK